MRTSVIRSEEDAWKFLALQSDQIALHNPYENVVFDGWPRLTVVLDPGDSRGNRQTGRVVRMLQKKVDLTYALAKYGELNARRLTARDRAAIKITHTVLPGSSKLTIYLEKAAEAFAKLPDGMSSRDRRNALVYSAVGIAVVLVSGNVTLSFLKDRSETDRLQISLIEQTKQLALSESSHKKALDTIQKVSENTLAAAQVSTQDHHAATDRAKQLEFVFASETIPVTKFAASDYSLWRVAVLDLAPKGGTLKWGAIVLPEPQAKAIKRRALKAANNERRKARSKGAPQKIDTPWLTSVAFARDLPPPMRLGRKSV